MSGRTVVPHPTRSGVGRLVLVSTAHCRWPRDARSLDTHALLLSALLDPTAPGQAWFACLDREERDAAASGSSVGEDGRDPARWHRAGEPVLAAFLADLRAACPAEAALAGYRHRVHLDAERLLAVTGSPGTRPTVPFEVVLDLRLCLLRGAPVCQVILSVWSDSPWSRHHGPSVTAAAASPASRDLLADGLDAEFSRVRRGAEALIDRYFTVIPHRLSGRACRGPVFWTLVPMAAVDDPVEFLDGRGRLTVDHAGGRLLGVADVRDASVSCSVLRGDVLVLRRMVPRGDDDLGRDVPTYLLLPARAVAGPEDGTARLAGQEDAVRRLITALSGMEAQVAAQLGDVEADLEVWDAQLDAYDSALERVGRIWEGLASHLLVERRGALARLYESVQVLHQTLITSEPETHRLRTAVRRSADAVADAVGEPSRHLAGDLTEVRAGHVDVSGAVSSSPDVVAIGRRVDALERRASRLVESHASLLVTIGHAFNERRVRVNDVLQRSGALLAVVVAVFGPVTAASGMTHGYDGWLWLPAGAVGGAVLLWARAYVRIGTLGGSRYRFVYRRLWNFLRLVSSSRLDPLAEHVTTEPEERRARLWAGYDRELSSEFARIWDLIDLLPGDERTIEVPATARASVPRRAGLGEHLALRRALRADRRQLRRMVEKWSLRTLLFTERPRDLRRYELVQLTAMYRAVFPLMGREGHVVSTTELSAVLARYPHQGLRRCSIDLVTEWIDVEAGRLNHEWRLRPSPDQLRPPETRRARTAVGAMRDTMHLMRRASGSDRDGRGARMLAVLRRAGLRTGLGGELRCGQRVRDRRNAVMHRIAGRLGPQRVEPDGGGPDLTSAA